MFLELKKLTNQIIWPLPFTIFLKKAKIFAHSLSDLLNNVWYMVFEIFEREFGVLISPTFDHVIKKWMCFWFRKNTSFMYKTFENSVWKEESKLDLVVPKVHFSSWLFYLRNCFFQYTTCTSLLTFHSIYLF